MTGAGSIQMPRYQCHKTVYALKIAAIRQGEDAPSDASYGGSWLLVPENADYAPIEVSHAYYTKHAPQVGGYYVVYEDGYKSFSPADAFEGGYTLIREE